MISKQEIIFIILASLVLGYSFALFKGITWSIFFYYILLFLITLIINTAVKKITAYKLGCNVNIKLIKLKRFGFQEHFKFKRAIPLWLILPILIALVSLGNLFYLGIMSYDIEVIKRRIIKKFEQVDDFDIAKISYFGILSHQLMALIFMSFGYNTFAYLNAWFALFSLIPLFDLDGMKIFFGSRILFVFAVVSSLAIIILMGVFSPILSFVFALFLAIASVIVYYINEFGYP